MTSDGSVYAPVATTMLDHPCVLFALRRESAPFRRLFSNEQPIPASPCPAFLCRSAYQQIGIVETGVGASRTEAALHWLGRLPRLGHVEYRPRFIISAGFAGALDERLAVGDTLVAQEVVDQRGNRWPTTWPTRAADALEPPIHRGRLLTMPRLIGDPAQKQSLARQHHAQAVDMESAAVARWCTENGTPFGCIRAISDDARTCLSPRLVNLVEGGRVSAWRVTSALLRRPTLLAELWRLGRATSLAAKRLARVLNELVVGHES